MTNHNLIETLFPAIPLRHPWPTSDYGLKVDIAENNQEFTVQAEVPGINKDNLDVQFHDNVLTITAAVEDEDKNQPRTILRERFSGKYERSFRFNKEIDRNSISAKLNDGLLTIKISKRDPEIAKRERSVVIE